MLPQPLASSMQHGFHLVARRQRLLPAQGATVEGCRGGGEAQDRSQAGAFEQGGDVATVEGVAGAGRIDDVHLKGGLCNSCLSMHRDTPAISQGQDRRRRPPRAASVWRRTRRRRRGRRAGGRHRAGRSAMSHRKRRWRRPPLPSAPPADPHRRHHRSTRHARRPRPRAADLRRRRGERPRARTGNPVHPTVLPRAR